MGRKPTKNLNLPTHLRARQQRSGKTYYYYDTGESPRREIPLGSDYALAIKRWSEIRLEKESLHTNVITFGYVAARFLRDELPLKSPNTQRLWENCLKRLLGFFNDPPAALSDIQPQNIRAYLDTRRDSPVRANRERALFSVIWNHARQWGYTDRTNPCDGVRGFAEKGRDIYVEDSIYQAVYNAADQATRDAMDMAYLTAQRPADTLKFQETDIKDGTLNLRQNKTGKRLRINIVGELETLIARITARKKAHSVHCLALICNERGQALTQSALRARFDKARIKAAEDNPELTEQIRAFQFRDLRAKGGTDKAETAGDIRQAQILLGHSSVVMSEHYIRQRKGDKSDPTR